MYTILVFMILLKVQGKNKKGLSPNLIKTTRSAKSPPFLVGPSPQPGDQPHPTHGLSGLPETFYSNPQMIKGGGTFLDMPLGGANVPLGVADMPLGGAESPETVDLPQTPDSDIVQDKVQKRVQLLFFWVSAAPVLNN